MSVERFVDNDGVKLHCVVNHPISNGSDEILFLPSLVDEKNIFLDEIHYFKECYTSVLDLRGRGLSSAPSSGYKVKNFVSDIDKCLKELNMNFPLIVASSLSSVYAIQYLLNFKTNVRGLIVIDHGASCIPYTKEWYNHYLTLTKSNLNSTTAKALVKESEFINLFPELSNLEFPIHILAGSLSNSLLNIHDVNDYKRYGAQLKIIDMPNSGHSISKKDSHLLKKSINRLLK